jgi:hypothetical protein
MQLSFSDRNCSPYFVTICNPLSGKATEKAGFIVAGPLAEFWFNPCLSVYCRFGPNQTTSGNSARFAGRILWWKTCNFRLRTGWKPDDIAKRKTGAAQSFAVKQAQIRGWWCKISRWNGKAAIRLTPNNLIILLQHLLTNPQFQRIGQSAWIS